MHKIIHVYVIVNYMVNINSCMQMLGVLSCSLYIKQWVFDGCYCMANEHLFATSTLSFDCDCPDSEYPLIRQCGRLKIYFLYGGLPPYQGLPILYWHEQKCLPVDGLIVDCCPDKWGTV